MIRESVVGIFLENVSYNIRVDANLQIFNQWIFRIQKISLTLSVN